MSRVGAPASGRRSQPAGGRRFSGLGRLLVFALLAACGDDEPTGDPVFGLPDGEHWPDPRGYPGVGDGRILITNNLDDTVSILDLAAVGTDELAVIATVPVGLVPAEREGPHHVAADPSGEYYYVGISNFVPGSGSGPHGVHGAGTADGHASKIRAADNVEVAAVRVDRNPGDIRITPDGRLLLQSHFDLLRITEVFQSGGDPSEMDSNLVVIDPVSMTRLARVPVCPAAHGIAIAPDGSTAYVSCIDDSMVVVDLTTTDYTTAKIAVLPEPGPATGPICYPYAMTMAPAGDSVWVSCYLTGEVRRFDVEAGTMDPARIATLPGPALFGTFTDDGSTLLVPYQQLNGLAFIDPADASINDDISLMPDECIAPHAVELTEDERFIILVCEGDHIDPGTLVVLDAESRLVQRVVELGRFPDDLAILRSP